MLRAASLGRNTNTKLIEALKNNCHEFMDISSNFVFRGADMDIYTFIEQEAMDFMSDLVS